MSGPARREVDERRPSGPADGDRDRVKVLRRTARIVGLSGVVYLAYRERHLFQGLGHSMAGLHWVWLLGAGAVQLGSLLPLPEGQRLVLLSADVQVPRFRMWLITLASNAISSSVPGGLAIAEGYSYRQYRRFSATRRPLGSLSAAALFRSPSRLASGVTSLAATLRPTSAGGSTGSPIDWPILPPISADFARRSRYGSGHTHCPVSTGCRMQHRSASCSSVPVAAYRGARC